MKNKVKNNVIGIFKSTPASVKRISFATALVAGEAIANFAMCAADLNQIMGSILGVLATVFLYVGILLLCWGIGQLVLAFKNEDADSKSRAIMLIVASVFLIGIRTFLTAVLESTGSGITINDDGFGG